MPTQTLATHRIIRATPEGVYRAFVLPEAWAKWLPPHGFAARVEAMDARVGGRYRMTFIHLATGDAHAFGGEYRELVPGARLRYSARFDDPALPGELQTTVTLRGVAGGTELQAVQEGIPEVIPLAACELGWRQSLDLLALLTESERGG
jgi:uncharacterized protein YndB with AHSA1/START domain